MKILYEGGNLTEKDAQNIFKNYITSDYTLLESEEKENAECYLFSNKINLLKIESKYFKDTDLNFIRIIDLQKNSCDNKDEPLSFRIISYPVIDNLTLSYSQVCTQIEALIIYKDYLNKTEKTDCIVEARTNLEISKVTTLISYLQSTINYDYKVACNICINKANKSSTNRMMGLGEGAMEQSARKTKK